MGLDSCNRFNWIFDSVLSSGFPICLPGDTVEAFNYITNRKPPDLNKQPHTLPSSTHLSIHSYESKASISGFQYLHFPLMYYFFVVIVPDSNDLAFPPGALYSRKFTIDGEQISLQVQDTPFVSLEVKHLLSASVLYNTVTVSCLLSAC